MASQNRSFWQHPFVLALQIIAIVYFMDFGLMEVVKNFESEFVEKNESLIGPLFLVFLAFPLLYFGVLMPWVRARNRAEEKLILAENEERNAKNQLENLMKAQKVELEAAVTKAVKDMEETQERYALIAKASNDALWELHLPAGAAHFSKRWKEMLGFNEHDPLSSYGDFLGRIHEEDRDIVIRTLNASQIETKNDCWELEFRMVGKKGQVIWVLNRWVVVKDGNLESARLIGVQSDISERKKYQERLEFEALYDPLTGLANRSLLFDRVKQSIERILRDKNKGFTLILFDLDNFKRINDALGHDVGDEVLCEVAARLKSVSRASETIARLGGDEFVILLDEALNKPQFQLCVDRIFDIMQTPFSVNGIGIDLRLSVGAVNSEVLFDNAIKSKDAYVPEKVLASADMALTEAKKSGRGLVMQFNPRMNKKAEQDFIISASLKDALASEALSMFYQPIVDIKNKKVAGFEALMRWRHDEFGWIPPSDFIPIAEESNLINDLGVFALKRSLSDFKDIMTEYNLFDAFMSVNMSARQLEDSEFVSVIKELLSDLKLLPHHLKIELTETVFINNPKQGFAIFDELKSLGVKLALDDFGVGYSSISTLHQFAFDTLKIDRSFLMERIPSERSKKMIELTHILAEALKMNTVVEGVEWFEQLQLLQSIGLNYIQGYYFSKPLSKDDLFIRFNNSLNPFDWAADNQKMLVN